MKKILLLCGFLLSASTITANKLEIVKLDMNDRVVTDPLEFPKVKKQLDKIIKYQVDGKPEYNPYSWNRYIPFTPKEGKAFFSAYVRENLKDHPNKDALFDAIFSDQHFIAPQVETHQTDEEIFEDIYDDDDYFVSHMCNVLHYGKKLMKPNNVHTFVHLIPPTLIKKIFYRNLNPSRFAYNFQKWNEIESRTYEDYCNEIFSEANFGIPDSESDRTAFFLSHDIAFLTQNNFNAYYRVARHILEQTQQGDRIVIFGDSCHELEYFVGRALRVILAGNPDIVRHIIDFPCAGVPITNEDSDDDRIGNSLFLVTAERLAHLKKRLTNAGLMADNAGNLTNTSTYFVRAKTQADSLSLTIEEILKDFKRNNVDEVPDLRLIELDRGDGDNDADRDDKNVTDDVATMTSLFSADDTHIKIPTRIISMHDYKGVFFRYPPHFRPTKGDYYPAFWADELDEYMALKPSFITQIMYDHFDVNIRARMEAGK